MIDRLDAYESHIDEQLERYGLRQELNEIVSYAIRLIVDKGESSVSVPIEDTNPHKVAVLFSAVKQKIESENPNLHVTASSWPRKDRTKDGSKYETVIFVSKTVSKIDQE